MPQRTQRQAGTLAKAEAAALELAALWRRQLDEAEDLSVEAADEIQRRDVVVRRARSRRGRRCGLARCVWNGSTRYACPSRGDVLKENLPQVAADSSPDNANRELVYGTDLFAKTKALLAGAPEAGGPGA